MAEKIIDKSQGWIKLYRKSIDSPVFENSIYWKVWTWCLLRANHQREMVFFNGIDVEVMPGQFVTGRLKACDTLKITAREHRTAFSYLLKTHRVSIKTTNKYSLITILNWTEYQNSEGEATHKATHRATGKTTQTRHRPDQQNDTKQEVFKNDENDKKVEEANPAALFSIPSISEIKNYADSIGYVIDAEKFIHTYSEKNWQGKDGRNIDWQERVRFWKATEKGNLNTLSIEQVNLNLGITEQEARQEAGLG